MADQSLAVSLPLCHKNEQTIKKINKLNIYFPNYHFYVKLYVAEDKFNSLSRKLFPIHERASESPEAQNNKNQIPWGSINEIKILAELNDTSENNLFVLYCLTFFTQTRHKIELHLVISKGTFWNSVSPIFLLKFYSGVFLFRHCFPSCLFSKYRWTIFVLKFVVSKASSRNEFARSSFTISLRFGRLSRRLRHFWSKTLCKFLKKAGKTLTS